MPIGAAAVAMLSGLPRTSQWVFPRLDPSEPVSIDMLERRGVGSGHAALENARLHDLRHTRGTYAGQAGLNAFAVRDLLEHKTLAMAGLYVSRDTNPLRAADDVVSSQSMRPCRAGQRKSSSLTHGAAAMRDPESDADRVAARKAQPCRACRVEPSA